jgi:hypothetical protein
MRIRLSLIALTLILGVLITGCKKPPPVTKTDEEIQIEKLTGTWVLDPGVTNPVTVDNNNPPQDWTGFTLTLGNKTYQANSSASLGDVLVWPTSGSWAFGTSVSTLVRDDGIDISVSVTDTSLQMQFNYSASGGRLNGIEGFWKFKMVPQ